MPHGVGDSAGNGLSGMAGVLTLVTAGSLARTKVPQFLFTWVFPGFPRRVAAGIQEYEAEASRVPWPRVRNYTASLLPLSIGQA